MKTWSAGAVVLVMAVFLGLAGGARASIGVNDTGILSSVSSIRVSGTGNDVTTATTTLTAATAAEFRGFLWDGTYAGSDGTALPSTIWSFMHYNQTGSVTTGHGGAIFGRAIAGLNAQGFHFGVEGNDWNNSTQSTGNGVGIIGHAVWEGAATSTPTATTIGVEARAEITDPSISTPRTGITTADVMAFRGETYGGQAGATWNSRNYNFYGAVGGSQVGKIVNNGPIMALAVAAQTIASGDTIFSDGCGTVKQVTASGAVSTSATVTFSTPSVLSDGTANTGCVMTVVNSGANTITLKNNATALTYGGVDVNLPSAGSVMFISNGGTWVQSGRVVVTTLAGVYISSVTSAVPIAASGSFGNTGSITLLPGDWDVTGVCDVVAGGGAAVTAMQMAISQNTGNTTTDHVTGDNQINIYLATAANDASGSINGYRVAVAANTAIFVKIKGTYTVATPTASCRISARRVN